MNDADSPQGRMDTGERGSEKPCPRCGKPLGDIHPQQVCCDACVTEILVEFRNKLERDGVLKPKATQP